MVGSCNYFLVLFSFFSLSEAEIAWLGTGRSGLDLG